ncbi:MAG: DUF5050 domain-containing protein [Oscillospiraceae bacterium]|nr:DUF5050 domain-containing protein [Oscillospiraceae bacterium]MCL2159146.1 DUF5050 domain-containing protein [Oscillospiraceae bacterium]
MKKLMAFVFAASVSLACFSCHAFDLPIELGNNFNNVNLLCGACDDENHVYYISADKKIMRLSKETGALTDMGIYAEFLGTLSIIDGYLHVNSAESDGGCVVETKPCKINLSRIKEITYFDYETTHISSVGDPVMAIGDTIYFGGGAHGGFQKINRDGTGGAAIDDQAYRVMGVENNWIYAHIIEDEKAEQENKIIKSMTWIYKLSPNWETKEKLFQFCHESQFMTEEGRYHGLDIFPAIFGDYLYCIEPTGYDPERLGFCDFQLYRNRLSKNSKKEILFEFGDDYARILAITDDGIYFYREEADTHHLSNIYRANHDGTEPKETQYKYNVYNFEEDGYYFVSNIDGKLYGIIENKIVPVE